MLVSQRETEDTSIGAGGEGIGLRCGFGSGGTRSSQKAPFGDNEGEVRIFSH